MDLLFLLIGLLAGTGLGYLLHRVKSGPSAGASAAFEAERAGLLARQESLQAELQSWREKADALQGENTGAAARLARAEEALQQAHQRIKEEGEKAKEFKERFEAEFRVLAQSILHENSRQFTEQNKEKLGEILNPFREKLSHFEAKVQNHYETELKERSSLKDQVNNLVNQSQLLSQEAKNLTEALKGNVKKQGNWGELILETILEKSGLQKGREYDVQQSMQTEEGFRLQPDVVVHLPDQKDVIIDSKVSLVPFDRLVAASSKEEEEAAIRDLLVSIRQHFKGLGSKNYQGLLTGSLDFVLLFIPIEGAFSTAMQHDPNLFQESFEANVLLVSPSTLLATLRTIANVWKLEYTNRNAMKIADEGGKLYDAFARFVDDLQKVGKSLDSGKTAYDDAMKRLAEGRGNLLGRVEKLKGLGLKTQKSLPQNLLDEADHATESDE